MQSRSSEETKALWQLLDRNIQKENASGLAEVFGEPAGINVREGISPFLSLTAAYRVRIDNFSY